jgi:hypothetical protein
VATSPLLCRTRAPTTVNARYSDLGRGDGRCMQVWVEICMEQERARVVTRGCGYGNVISRITGKYVRAIALVGVTFGARLVVCFSSFSSTNSRILVAGVLFVIIS